MSVRQYIGARYTTKIYENSLDPSSAEWEASVTYEPFTMVTYNNSTYLSKKQIPGSVGNPSDNPDYWVVTGYYNGQIMQLQNDIQTVATDLQGLIDDIHGYYITPEMFGAVGDGVTDDSAAFQGAIDFLGNTGGTILLGKKTYCLANGLTLKGDLRLLGVSHVATKVYFTGNGVMLDPAVTMELIINDIFFYSVASPSSIYKAGTTAFKTSGNFTLDRVAFENFEIVSEWNGGYYHHFSNVWVTDCRRGFWKYNQNNLTFTKCRFRRLEQAIYTNAGEGPLTLTGCSFENICRFVVSGINAGVCTIIQGCYFENENVPVKPGFTSDDGTYASGSVIYTSRTKKMTISLLNNVFEGYFFRILYPEATSPDPGYVLIANGNFFSIDTGAGLSYIYAIPSTGQCIANDSFDPAFPLALSKYINNYDVNTCRIIDPTTNTFNY